MEEKKNKKNPPVNQFQVLQSILKMGPSKEDPQGMYTGKPVNIEEVPVQDSDDL